MFFFKCFSKHLLLKPINIKNVIEMQKVDSCTCNQCYYFFNCQTHGIDDIHEFCLTNPEALGYCELWGGAIKNCEACHGYTPKKKK